MNLRILRQLSIWAGAALLYFSAAKLGVALGATYHVPTAIWPPSGIAMAVVLLFGRQLWPGLWLGAFLLQVFSLPSAGGFPAVSTATAAAIATGNTLEAVAGAWLVGRYAQGIQAFQHPQALLIFTALAGVLSTGISATIGALAPGHGLLQGQTVWEFWFTWWFGDLVSVVVLTPLIVLWADWRPPAWNRRRAGEGLVWFVLLAAACEVAFGGWFSAQTGMVPLIILPIIVLLWSALRFGPRSTATGCFVVACLATLGTFLGHGPFASSNRNLALLFLQNYVAAVTVMSLLLASDVAQRQRIEAGLRASEQRYRELFEHNPQPMWVCDQRTLRFLAVNEAAVGIYGYAREDFLRMRLTDINPVEDAPALLEAVARAPGAPGIPSLCRHRKKDGTIMDVEVRRHPMQFDQRPALMTLVTEITQRKQAEKRAAAFSDLGLRLSAATTPKQAAQIIMETADTLFGWDACTFDLCSADGERVQTVLGMDTVAGRRRDVTAECHNGPPSTHTRSVLAEGPRLLLRPDPPSSDVGMNAFGDRSRRSASLMFAPVRQEGRAIGLLSIQSYAHKAYTEADLRTLQALADHCGGALERIQAQSAVMRLNAELERRVGERTAQLEATNKELEAFSYSVSHDLRAPLRSIRGFSELLLERYTDQLDARGREFLRRTCESSQQMDRLIEDVLKLSRVGRSELQLQRVNLSALAQAVVNDLRQAEPQRATEIAVVPNLVAQGDERLLRILLENLLRNAWKFTSKQPHPHIEFGRQESPRPAFFVRDNGAGFDMTYVGRLFGVFQRLHSAEEFPGTGVGLATVQRIVNRHGGRVWAEGAIGSGATFFFTLPDGTGV